MCVCVCVCVCVCEREREREREAVRTPRLEEHLGLRDTGRDSEECGRSKNSPCQSSCSETASSALYTNPLHPPPVQSALICVTRSALLKMTKQGRTSTFICELLQKIFTIWAASKDKEQTVSSNTAPRTRPPGPDLPAAAKLLATPGCCERAREEAPKP